LAGRETAIVTDIAGTTRDVLREHIHLDGMPLHIIDTAGLRDAPDQVERIGIDRAWQEIHKADRILMVVDSSETSAQTPEQIWPEFVAQLADASKITVIRNKIDLQAEKPTLQQQGEYSLISSSPGCTATLPPAAGCWPGAAGWLQCR